MEDEKEFNFTQEDFNALRQLVKNQTGIISDENKYTMYYSRLSRRLRQLNLVDFAAYRVYLDQNKNTETVQLVNAVTTNLTAFFREEHHFDFVKEQYIQDKIKAKDKRIRIWSAACSTGEEPYSIAMSLIEAIDDIEDWDIKIFATDIDSNVLKTAQAGVYGTQRIEDLAPARIKRFMKKGVGKNAGFVKMNSDVQKLIRFKQLNLLQNWPLKEKLDIIFCRNVVIYFDNDTKAKLVDRFANQLNNNAYLMMGHSESLYNASDRFELLGKSIYKKL